MNKKAKKAKVKALANAVERFLIDEDIKFRKEVNENHTSPRTATDRSAARRAQRKPTKRRTQNGTVIDIGRIDRQILDF